MSSPRVRIHQEMKGILDPAIEVRVGAFRSTIMKMTHDGWIFEMESEMHSENQYLRDMVLLARNPRHNMVGYSMIHNIREKSRPIYYENIPYLYFNSELLIGMETAKKFVLPKMTMHPVAVGEFRGYETLDGSYSSHTELITYEANVDPEHAPKEIIVMPDDVNDLLDRIIELQTPRAKEIIAGQQQQDRLGKMQMQAKILTFK